LFGVTAIETSAKELTLTAAEPLMAPSEAVIVLDPTPKPLASPVPVIPTTPG